MSISGSWASLRRAGWLGTLTVVIVLAAAGWAVHVAVADVIRERLRHELEAFVIADATAVEVWIANKRGEAAALASDPIVAGDPASRTGEDLAALRERLSRASVRMRFEGFVLEHRERGRIAASGEGVEPIPAALFHRALSGESFVSLPFLETTTTGDGASSAGAAAMLACAPVVNDAGTVTAVLGLRIAPRREFTRLLGPARSGYSGETFVFDRDGRMLSESRFDDQLREAGLLDPTPGSSAMLVLELRNPEGDLVSGYRPGKERRSLGLTLMAGNAVAGKSGVNLEGYRSYRGVPVIGAWKWLEGLGLGIATEMEVDEAYAPLAVLREAFLLLAALIAIVGGASVVLARRHVEARRTVQYAELEEKRLGQYTLLKKIGEGGMGEVYLARHAMLARPTAVKLLRPDRTSEQAIARFEREVQQTSRLTHPNTVQIYDFGRTPEGIFYYAMEYLVGVGLDEFVENEGPLPEGRVIYILQQICGSLNEAHGLGLVHRDIKPDNVALCRAGGAFDVAKVLDFGLVMDRKSQDPVKLSGAGTITGTPLYMSPEAFTSPATVDARSDIYSVGAVGYFLLTGQPVFAGETVIELFNQHTKQKPVPPSERAELPILPDVDQAILACLQKDPGRRPESANALARELDWCRSSSDWNRDKARYWWQENQQRMEALYGLSSREPVAHGGQKKTITVELRGRHRFDA